VFSTRCILNVPVFVFFRREVIRTGLSWTGLMAHTLEEQTAGNEKISWIGLIRRCGLGDAGNATPCSDPLCLLCCFVRGTVRMQPYPDGIMVAESPSK